MNKYIITFGWLMELAIGSNDISIVLPTEPTASTEALNNMLNRYKMSVDFLSELFLDVNAYSENPHFSDIVLSQPDARELCLPIFKFMKETRNLSESNTRIDALLKRNSIVVRLSFYSAVNQSTLQAECNNQLKRFHQLYLHSYVLRMRSLLYLVGMRLVSFEPLRSVGPINHDALRRELRFYSRLQKTYAKLRPPTRDPIYLTHAETETFDFARNALMVGLFPCMLAEDFCTSAHSDIEKYLEAFYVATGQRHLATSNLLTQLHGQFWRHFQAITNSDWSLVPKTSPIIGIMVELRTMFEHYNNITELCGVLEDNLRQAMNEMAQLNGI